jgi:uncharacterized OsmC-like protein/alpha/beta superfamily hydrolase
LPLVSASETVLTMKSQKLKFPNQQGQHLAARLDLPLDARPRAYALFAHCFTCSKNLRAVGNLTRALVQAGIGVLRFDFTGLGESEGDFADTNFSSNVADLVAAARFLAEEYEAPKLLIGHSLGGSAVLQAADKVPSATAVVTIGAPADPQHVAHLLKSSEEEIQRSGEAVVTLAGRDFTIKKQFLDDLEENNMRQVIGALRRALLVCHAPLDNTVGVDNAADIFLAARHPKSYLSLDQADHLLSNNEDSVYAGSVIAAWASKYIGTLQPDAARPLRPEKDRVVVRTGMEHYRTEIMAGGHGLYADEPVAAGGTDQGPSPYDLLLAGLGSCTTITLRMYADRKEWPLEEIIVHLNHNKIHARDCATCEQKEGKLDRIQREVELIGNLTPEQRQRLLEIADKCPVHRTLHSKIVVETTLKPAEGDQHE